jgi:hypothetical protein
MLDGAVRAGVGKWRCRRTNITPLLDESTEQGKHFASYQAERHLRDQGGLLRTTTE